MTPTEQQHATGLALISIMSMGHAISLLVAVVTVGTVAAQTTFPVLNITKGQPLPILQELQPENDWITLNLLPATIQVRERAGAPAKF